MNAYKPALHAEDLFKCRDKIIAITGPARCGKSRAALEKILLYALKYPGVRILLTRKTRVSMTESILETLERHVIPTGSPWVGNITRSTRQKYILPNSSEIVVCGLDMPQKVLSSEYDYIYVGEAIETDANDYEILLSRLSGRNAPYRQVVLDTNPGSPSHWIKQRIDSSEIHNIQFQFSDNPVLDQDVLDSLKLLTGHRYSRLYLGQWCSAEGIIYDTSSCICPHQEAPKGEYYGAVDFGFKDPFGALLGVVYHDQAGKQILYIHTERKVNEQPITVHAQWLKANAHPDTILFCDHENPEAIRELQKHDLSAQSANKNIIFGIESVQSLIAGNKLFISDRLTNLLAETSSLVYDVLTEKPAKNQDDHLSDCLRYLCATLRSNGMLEIDSARST